MRAVLPWIAAAAFALAADAGEAPQRVDLDVFLGGAYGAPVGVSFELPAGFENATDLLPGSFTVWGIRPEVAGFKSATTAPASGFLSGKWQIDGRSFVLGCNEDLAKPFSIPGAPAGWKVERRVVGDVTLTLIDITGPQVEEGRRMRTASFAWRGAPAVYTLNFVTPVERPEFARAWDRLVASFAVAAGTVAWSADIPRPTIGPGTGGVWTVAATNRLFEHPDLTRQTTLLDGGLRSASVLQPFVKGAIGADARIALYSVDTGPGFPADTVCAVHADAAAAFTGKRLSPDARDPAANFVVNLAFGERMTGAQAEVTMVALVSRVAGATADSGQVVGVQIVRRRYNPDPDPARRAAQRLALARQIVAENAGNLHILGM